jgi:FemAB-related protein (PEP-CTERM system-associated)
MQDNITYRLATETDAAAWDEFLASHVHRTFAHRWNWSLILGKSFKVKPVYCVASRDGRAVGIFPSTLMKSIVFGKFMISLPWLDYGGPLAESADIARGLVDYATAIARKAGCRFVEMRAVSEPLPELVDKCEKYSFVLRLAENEEAIWQSIDGKAKNQIRKAIKSGLTVQFGGAELLEEFYKIFSRNMHDLGTPVWPKSLFAELFRHFPDDTEIALVKLGELSIGGGLVVHYLDYSAVPSASSYRNYLNLCPNNILYWEVIKRCFKRGSSYFDFGRSSLNAGTYNFKKQWIRNPSPQTWQYKLLTIDSLPELNPSNPKFRWAINAWKLLPLPIANVLGPKIVTKLP